MCPRICHQIRAAPLIGWVDTYRKRNTHWNCFFFSVCQVSSHSARKRQSELWTQLRRCTGLHRTAALWSGTSNDGHNYMYMYTWSLHWVPPPRKILHCSKLIVLISNHAVCLFLVLCVCLYVGRGQHEEVRQAADEWAAWWNHETPHLTLHRLDAKGSRGCLMLVVSLLRMVIWRPLPIMAHFRDC